MPCSGAEPSSSTLIVQGPASRRRRTRRRRRGLSTTGRTSRGCGRCSRCRRRRSAQSSWQPSVGSSFSSSYSSSPCTMPSRRWGAYAFEHVVVHVVPAALLRVAKRAERIGEAVAQRGLQVGAAVAVVLVAVVAPRRSPSRRPWYARRQSVRHPSTAVSSFPSRPRSHSSSPWAMPSPQTGSVQAFEHVSSFTSLPSSHSSPSSWMPSRHTGSAQFVRQASASSAFASPSSQASVMTGTVVKLSASSHAASSPLEMEPSFSYAKLRRCGPAATPTSNSCQSSTFTTRSKSAPFERMLSSSQHVSEDVFAAKRMVTGCGKSTSIAKPALSPSAMSALRSAALPS